jgi:formylglycine-generating enzyme required for sulfatase activity
MSGNVWEWEDDCAGTSGAKDLQGVLRDDSHDLTKTLAHLGVRYLTTGQGRGARSYLLKH